VIRSAARLHEIDDLLQGKGYAGRCLGVCGAGAALKQNCGRGCFSIQGAQIEVFTLSHRARTFGLPCSFDKL
jgi:hypothetical protein